MSMKIEERDFKGVWIPKNIWLNSDLDIIEKCLLVEISSLCVDDAFCYASNEYFAKFFQCSERKISASISKLISLGLVEQAGFDGRKRYLEVRVENFAMLGSKFCEQNNISNNTNIKENYNKRNAEIGTETPTSTISLTATNEQPSSRQKVEKEISALSVYNKILEMYNKCGYKKKASNHKTNTIKKLTTICNNKDKKKRLHPLLVLMAYGVYLAECRDSHKESDYVKQSDTFLTSMVYDYAEQVEGFEERVVQKYGENWGKYRLVD